MMLPSEHSDQDAKKELKLIVAGGRDFDDVTLLDESIDALAYGEYADRAVSIVTGMALGADTLAWDFAKTRGVQFYTFPANWRMHGLRAGFIRNSEMATFADALLAFWDGKSRGTRHMINVMKQRGKPVHVINYPLKDDATP